MKKTALALVVLLIAVSCQKKEAGKKPQDDKACTAADSTHKGGKKFEMYAMSEMAALMEQMYVENQRVKEKITRSEPIGKFPDYYRTIHTAQFTDESENDAYFREKAKSFIEVQQKLYADTNPAHARENYNNGVDACISCHENKCGGPIPKIKKLYLR